MMIYRVVAASLLLGDNAIDEVTLDIGALEGDLASSDDDA